MTKPPDQQRRSEKSRQAILAAAMDLCAEHGYRQLTVEAIAARAGVSKKTIYRWWPSKGAVLLEAVDDRAIVETEYPDTGDLAADMHTQLTAVIGFLVPTDTSALTGLLAEGLHDPDLGRSVRDRLLRPKIEDFNARLRSAQDRGQLPRDTDLTVALNLFYGPLYHRLAFHLEMPDATTLTTLITHALKALDYQQDAPRPA